MLLCFVFRCPIGNIVTIISYHRRPARWSTPFWQPAYRLHFIFTFIFCLWQINSAAAAPVRTILLLLLFYYYYCKIRQ